MNSHMLRSRILMVYSSEKIHYLQYFNSLKFFIAVYIHIEKSGLNVLPETRYIELSTLSNKLKVSEKFNIIGEKWDQVLQS